jgi:hypothetical protein
MRTHRHKTFYNSSVQATFIGPSGKESPYRKKGGGTSAAEYSTHTPMGRARLRGLARESISPSQATEHSTEALSEFKVVPIRVPALKNIPQSTCRRASLPLRCPFPFKSVGRQGRA